MVIIQLWVLSQEASPKKVYTQRHLETPIGPQAFSTTVSSTSTHLLEQVVQVSN